MTWSTLAQGQVFFFLQVDLHFECLLYHLLTPGPIDIHIYIYIDFRTEKFRIWVQTSSFVLIQRDKTKTPKPKHVMMHGRRTKSSIPPRPRPPRHVLMQVSMQADLLASSLLFVCALGQMHASGAQRNLLSTARRSATSRTSAGHFQTRLRMSKESCTSGGDSVQEWVRPKLDLCDEGQHSCNSD